MNHEVNFLSPAMRKKRIAAVKAYLASESQEARKHRCRGIVAYGKTIPRKERLRRIKIAQAGGKRWASNPANIASLAAKIKATRKKNGSYEGKNNPQSRSWKLISPEGVRFQITGLAFWMKNNAHLFDKDHAELGKDGVPKAYHSIKTLSPRFNTRQQQMALGWTWDYAGSNMQHIENRFSKLTKGIQCTE